RCSVRQTSPRCHITSSKPATESALEPSCAGRLRRPRPQRTKEQSVLGGSGELSFKTWLQPKRLWLMVPVEVAERITIDLVLDTGSPLSGLSQRVWGALSRQGLL